jgi:NADH:ubiquinone oxidoreductase subunit 6 (subunit J)
MDLSSSLVENMMLQDGDVEADGIKAVIPSAAGNAERDAETPGPCARLVKLLVTLAVPILFAGFAIRVLYLLNTLNDDGAEKSGQCEKVQQAAMAIAIMQLIAFSFVMIKSLCKKNEGDKEKTQTSQLEQLVASGPFVGFIVLFAYAKGFTFWSYDKAKDKELAVCGTNAAAQEVLEILWWEFVLAFWCAIILIPLACCSGCFLALVFGASSDAELNSSAVV